MRLVGIIAVVAGCVACIGCEKPQEPTGTVIVRRHYAAEWNAQTLAIPEAERGWPGYRAAAHALGEFPEALGNWRKPVPTDSAEFERRREYVKEHAATIAAVREASAKPEWGIILTMQEEIPLSGPEPAIEEDPVLFEVMLPQFRALRMLYALLAMDVRDAIAAHDAGRVVADLHAMYNMAAHARQTHHLIGELVALACAEAASNEVARCIGHAPSLLNDEQLRAIGSRIESVSPHAWIREGFACEQLRFGDLLQRACTDDGDPTGTTAGDGIFTTDGWTLLTGACPDELRSRLPARTEVGTRKELMAEIEALHAAAAASVFFEQPITQWKERPHEAVRARVRRPEFKPKYTPVNLLSADLGRCVLAAVFTAARRDATLAMIAISRHRLKTGEWPKTLAELSPEYLPRVPTDPFDGKTLRYRIVDGNPSVYFVGEDHADDGGRAIESDETAQVYSASEVQAWKEGRAGAPNVRTGDVVLLPPQD